MERQRRERPVPDELIGKLLHDVVSQQIPRQLLKRFGATWVVHPPFAPSLDLAFHYRGEPVGVPLFGVENCVGIKVARDDDEVVSAFQELDRAHSLGNDLRVTVVTQADLEHWVGFYQELKETGVFDQVGPRSLSGFSGLERTSPEHSARLSKSFLELCRQNEDYLRACGVSEICPLGDIDFAFFNANGELLSVPLFNVRDAELEDGFTEILVKTVERTSTEVCGVAVRRPGETERQAWARARTFEGYFAGAARVAVGSDGQFSLWTKWGLARNPTAHLEGTGIDLREVLDFLYLGKSNVDPGILAMPPYNFSLPRTYSQWGADIIFEKRAGVSRHIIAIDDVLSLNISSRRKKGSSDFSSISNIGGVIIFPDGLSGEAMDEYATMVLQGINRPEARENIKFLFLNESLFKEWQRQETIFTLPPEELQSRDEPARKNSFGYGTGTLTALKLNFFYRGPKIGDMQMALIEERGREQTLHPMEFGSVYADVPPVMKEIVGRQDTQSGLRQSLNTGEIPMYPSLIYPPYLVAAAKEWPALGDPNAISPVLDYMRAEIARWADPGDLVNVVGVSRADAILRLGRKAEKRIYQNRTIAEGKAILTHGHNDHVGNAPLLKHEYVATWPTIGHLLALSNHSPNWMGKHTVFSRIDRPLVGSAYEQELRPMTRVYQQGQRVEVSPDTSAIFYFTDHSIESAAVGCDSSRGKFVFSGDIQPGPLTSEAIDLIAQEDYPVLLWECTNPPDTQKISAKVSVQEVYANMRRLLTSPAFQGRLVVVMAPTNHLKRLELLWELANDPAVQRQMIVGYKFADTINHLLWELKRAPLYATGRNIFLPEPGEHMGVYSKPMSETGRRPWQVAWDRRMMSSDIGIFRQEDLAANPGNILFVMSPYEFPEKVFGGANLPDVHLIYSAPYPYQYRDKSRVGGIKNQILAMGGHFHAGFSVHGMGGRVAPYGDPDNAFHSGGHASFEENMTLIQRAIGENYRGKVVYFVHGEHPEKYTQFASDWFKSRGYPVNCSQGATFIGTFNHYDKNNPFEHPGHIIQLG